MTQTASHSVTARLLGPCAACALVLTAASFAPAQTTWYVDANGVPPGSGTPGAPYTSVQYAIDQPATLPGDTVLVLPGTYFELVDFTGKTLSLVSSAGAAATTIDASSAVVPDQSTVTLASGEGPAARLEGFTLLGSFGTFANGAYRGGCVYLDGTSPTIADCVLQGGSADLGGGLYSLSGSPRIERTSFLDNDDFSILSGGGAYVDQGSAVFDACDFDGNNAWGLGGAGLYAAGGSVQIRACRFFSGSGYGGGTGAYLDASAALIEDCLFDSNSSIADNGGGLLVGPDAIVTVHRSSFVNNSVQDDHTGGAIYVAPGGAAGDLTVRASTIQGNYSARGGGVANFGTLRIEDTLILDNTAESFTALDGNGGGVYTASFGGASTHLVRCVLAGNQAIPGFSLQGEGGAVYGPALLENCTVVGNTANQGGGGACGATLLNTIHRDNAPSALCAPPAVTYSNVEGGAAGVGNIDLNPLFWDEPGRDYHLLLGSPCIDAGDPFGPLDPDGSRADLGAYPHDGAYSLAYCTAGTSAAGCRAHVATVGEASATASTGFLLAASGVEGKRNGLFFFSANGRQANPWGNGTSYQCVMPPVRRGSVLTGTGTAGACNGGLSFDLNAWWCQVCPRPAQNPGAGALVQAQAWYRDPVSTSNQNTSLSDAIEFQVQP